MWRCAGFLILVGAAFMWGWADGKTLPPYDFAGYVTQHEDLRDQFLRYGEVPVWSPRWYSGSTQFMSFFKERLALPLTLAFGGFRGTQLAVFLYKIGAGLFMFWGCRRYLGAPVVGAIAGAGYVFCASACYSSENVDVMLAYLLIAGVFGFSMEMFSRFRIWPAVGLGVFIAGIFCINLILALVAPLVVALVYCFRPWLSADGERDTRFVPRDEARRVGLVALALGIFALFAASQTAWFAADQMNHAPHSEEYVEKAIRHFAEQTPFSLANRANWLGEWLETHRTPYLRLFFEEPLRNQRHYVGAVAMLVIVLGGWFAGRDLRLRRANQMFLALFVVQWNLGMGPHSLLWQLARSFHWSSRLEAGATTTLHVAALAAFAGALAFWWRRSWRVSRSAEALVAAGLLVLLATTPLFAVLREALSLFDHYRSPGKFMELLPFPIFGMFAIGLSALLERIGERTSAVDKWRFASFDRRQLALLVAVSLMLAWDYWPARAAFTRGKPIDAVMEMREVVSKLPEGREEGRIAMHFFESPTWWVDSGLVTVAARLDAAWGWLPWWAAPDIQPFLEMSFSWLDHRLTDEERAELRPVGATLSRIGRFRYFLDEFRDTAHVDPRDTGPPSLPRTLDEGWERLASNRSFALWRQETVLPMAYAYSSYVVTVGDNYRPAAVTSHRAHQRGMAVIAGGRSLPELPPQLAADADLVVGLSDDIDSARWSRAEAQIKRRRGSDAEWLAPGSPDFSRRFREFFRARKPSGRLPVEVAEPRPGAFDLEVDAGADSTMVFVAEAHHPWWRATVDGRRTAVRRAHMAYMAVRTGPGRHRIELRLVPPVWVTTADWITRLAWLALGGAGLYACAMHLRRGRSPAG